MTNIEKYNKPTAIVDNNDGTYKVHYLDENAKELEETVTLTVEEAKTIGTVVLDARSKELAALKAEKAEIEAKAKKDEKVNKVEEKTAKKGHPIRNTVIVAGLVLVTWALVKDAEWLKPTDKTVDEDPTKGEGTVIDSKDPIVTVKLDETIVEKHVATLDAYLTSKGLIYETADLYPLFYVSNAKYFSDELVANLKADGLLPDTDEKLIAVHGQLIKDITNKNIRTVFADDITKELAISKTVSVSEFFIDETDKRFAKEFEAEIYDVIADKSYANFIEAYQLFLGTRETKVQDSMSELSIGAQNAALVIDGVMLNFLGGKVTTANSDEFNSLDKNLINIGEVASDSKGLLTSYFNSATFNYNACTLVEEPTKSK